MRAAVLDLGTNTFNLVIAEGLRDEKICILHSSRLPVKLGEGGINRGIILPGAFERGINAIKKHYKTITEHHVDSILAFGTSALRTASNSKDFLTEVKKITGIEVEIISGEKEAELIYHGVKQTIKMNDESCLILDIGGGSNEFIIAGKEGISWKGSFPNGIARLLEKFNPSDPIRVSEIEDIEKYLEETMESFIAMILNKGITKLLGASGSFETFVAMIHDRDITFEEEWALFPQSEEILIRDFDFLYRFLIRSTREERSQMRSLEPIRVEMIVLAAVFVNFIIRKLNIQTIIQSNFSLKEGAVYELLKNNSYGQYPGN